MRSERHTKPRSRYSTKPSSSDSAFLMARRCRRSKVKRNEKIYYSLSSGILLAEFLTCKKLIDA